MKALLLALLFAIVVSAAPLLDNEGPHVINGSYIVVLKESLNIHDRDAHILELEDRILEAKAHAEVSFVYNIGSFIGFAARLTPDLLKSELAHPDVKYISADQTVSINYKFDKPISPRFAVTQTGATWGLSRISKVDLPLGTTYTYNSTAGAGVSVYVIDTGILTTHTDFGSRATFAYSAITGEANSDLNGHGTHCSGTIAGSTYGVAKQASLYAVKVLSASGSGTTAGVVAGVNFVANDVANNNRKPAVASMSLGGGANTALDQAVSSAIATGIAFSIAAGNDNANACNYSPARVATAVTVGATTNTDARASYSNYGTCVHIFAPGSSITSDWIGSNTATNTISGTSMATPHVAGVLALHLSDFKTLSPAAARSWITGVATPNKVTTPGTGSPNLLLNAVAV